MAKKKETPKTVRQLLEQLPEPYKSKAIKNATPQSILDVANPGTQTPLTALASAFVFAQSKEGHTYWLDTVLKLETNGFN